jgi:hypothetical protein
MECSECKQKLDVSDDKINSICLNEKCKYYNETSFVFEVNFKEWGYLVILGLALYGWIKFFIHYF